MNLISFLILLAGVLLSLFQFSIHKIQEGHVGVYFRGGALLNRMTEPGFHMLIPFIDRVEQVQTSLQTDSVQKIPCGTSGGVLIEFDRVEVVNRLAKEHVLDTVRRFSVNYDKPWIFDKIHHEINQFCSKNSLQEIYIEKFSSFDDMLLEAIQESASKFVKGLEIIAVRITKPRLPHQIAENYISMEDQKTKLRIAAEHQKLVEKEAETDRKQAFIKAMKEKEVAEIRMQQEIMEKEARKTIEAISDSQLIAHERALADAKSYAQQELANANKLLLTDAYLQLQMIQAVANNTKVYFGDGIQGMFMEGFQDLFKK